MYSNLHMHTCSLIKQRARKQGMNFQFKSLKRMKKSYYWDETPWNKMYCQWLIQIALPKLKSQLQRTCRRSKGDQNKRWKNTETLSKPNIYSIEITNLQLTTQHIIHKSSIHMFCFHLLQKTIFIEIEKKYYGLCYG